MAGIPKSFQFVVIVFLVLFQQHNTVESKECGCHRTNKRRELSKVVFDSIDKEKENQNIEDLPQSFDWCKKGVCLPSWNQHIPKYCGSCYLHGSLSSAMSRIKIMHQKRGYDGPDVILGRQSFLNCAPAHNLSGGCDGGEASDVFEFMKRFGLPDESCLPYNATDHTKYTTNNNHCPPEGYCMNCMYSEDRKGQPPTCWPVNKVVRYKAKSYGYVSGEYAMMKELLNGPISCGIACSPEFSYHYKSGIFQDKTGFMDVDHDVEVIGWGEENGVKYWHVRNSWGTYWGMNGFFKIIRGVNNLGIESDCAYVHVDTTDEELVWGKHPSYGGSGYGIVPLGEKNSINDISDIVAMQLPQSHQPQQPQQPHQPLQLHVESSVVATSSVLGQWIFGVVVFSTATVGIAFAVLQYRKKYGNYIPLK